MTPPMPQLRLRNALLSLLLMGGIGTAALAEDGRFALPSKASEPLSMIIGDGFDAEQHPTSTFEVFVGSLEDCCEGRSSIAGQYQATERGWDFKPMFGFDAGRSYVVRRNGPESELVAFSIPDNADAEQAAVVTAIFPSGGVIPENTLRFYIHFSEPMKPHVAFDYIHLVDASGAVDDAAFMKFKQELWSPDRRRLTLLMDPGRIKRGVAQNLTLGPALQEGQSYSLVIDEGWPTAYGTASLERAVAQFDVAQPLRSLPNVEAWTFNSPTAGTTEALEIVFDRPFDAGQLQTELVVLDSSDRAFTGDISVEAGERRWSFVPNQPWPSDGVLLSVPARLEDVAGNNFNDLLDHAIDTEAKALESILVPLKFSKMGKQDWLQSN
ncbi:hypothetical protein ACS3SW_10520 [Roseobacteraceae bacterium S113]